VPRGAPRSCAASTRGVDTSCTWSRAGSSSVSSKPEGTCAPSWSSAIAVLPVSAAMPAQPQTRATRPEKKPCFLGSRAEGGYGYSHERGRQSQENVCRPAQEGLQGLSVQGQIQDTTARCRPAGADVWRRTRKWVGRSDRFFRLAASMHWAREIAQAFRLRHPEYFAEFSVELGRVHRRG